MFRRRTFPRDRRCRQRYWDMVEEAVQAEKSGLRLLLHLRAALRLLGRVPDRAGRQAPRAEERRGVGARDLPSLRRRAHRADPPAPDLGRAAPVQPPGADRRVDRDARRAHGRPRRARHCALEQLRDDQGVRRRPGRDEGDLARVARDDREGVHRGPVHARGQALVVPGAARADAEAGAEAASADLRVGARASRPIAAPASSASAR